MMTGTRIAVLSVHTSPLARLGSHDSGGMNVYVRRMSEELGRLGIQVDVFTRRSDSHSPAIVQFAPNARLLQQVVRFAGPREQNELPALYVAADVCVVPSYAESFGMVAVEAMACGTPVVASRVGGLQSTIIDGVTGFLVPSGHPDELARRIRQVLDSSELRERLGRVAVRAASRYRWPSVARELESLYGALISQPAQASAA